MDLHYLGAYRAWRRNTYPMRTTFKWCYDAAIGACRYDALRGIDNDGSSLY